MANKGQGLAMGAVVAAGLLLRPGGTPVPPPVEPKPAASAPAAPSATRAGPWIASCRYWAPYRPADDSQSKKVTEFHSEVEAKGSGTDIRIHLDETDTEPELGCNGDKEERWGVPKDAGGIDVTAIIAIVPDPVHSHLALNFDRAVDAILQAATDNDYVSSYYWLPWRNRLGIMKSAEPQLDAEPGHDPERERQPGLIVLKHVHDSSKVVYLFLVAETPTEGVDGLQLQKAFAYETQLEPAVTEHGRFSRGRNGQVAIIGPMYSGSAASLAAGIKTAKAANPDLPDFEVSGATGTKLPFEQLVTSTNGPHIHYLSFGDNGDYETAKLFDDHGVFRDSGYDLKRVALLIEDNTAYGSWTAKTRTGADRQVLVIRFPREISLLRNAQIGDQSSNEAGASGAIPSPYLRFSLKDSSAQDSVPQFSRDNTPLSQEAQLMTIAHQLHRYRTQFIAIAASNPLDQVYLAQFLHRACPDARLMFLGGDLLMAREMDDVPFIGSITIAPFPLLGLGPRHGVPTRAQPSDGSVVVL